MSPNDILSSINLLLAWVKSNGMLEGLLSGRQVRSLISEASWKKTSSRSATSLFNACNLPGKLSQIERSLASVEHVVAARDKLPPT